MSGVSDPSVFTPSELEAQQRWGKPEVWDPARIQRLILDLIPEELRPRIEAAAFFFLATSNRKGKCDCSFKGGGPGLVRVLNGRRLAFPDFDGNHAFMSLGNILDNPHVGLLFVDFADGGRLRVNGRATIHDKGPMLEWFRNAERIVVVDVEQVVPNCAAHVPRLIPASQ